MTVGSDNPFPSVLMQEHVDPTNPAAGYQRLFVDTDHLFKMVDSAGTVTTFSTSGGAMATDALWDAAGDLAVGTGANTGAKLTIGNAGGVLARINGAVAWNASTSFPTATTGDRFFRTDLGMEFYYDGTRWLSLQVFTIPILPTFQSATTEVGDLRSTIAATSSAITRIPSPSLLGASNIWLVDIQCTFIVNTGGTALGASHKWVGTVIGYDSTPTTTGTVATITIDSGSSAVFRQTNVTIGAARAANTLLYMTTWTKTGTPGTLQTGELLSYRIIGV